MSTSETHTSHEEVTKLNHLIELGDFLMARRVLGALDQASLSPEEHEQVARAQKLLGRDPRAVYITVGVMTGLLVIATALYFI